MMNIERKYSVCLQKYRWVGYVFEYGEIYTTFYIYTLYAYRISCSQIK